MVMQSTPIESNGESISQAECNQVVEVDRNYNSLLKSHGVVADRSSKFVENSERSKGRFSSLKKEKNTPPINCVD